MTAIKMSHWNCSCIWSSPCPLFQENVHCSHLSPPSPLLFYISDQRSKFTSTVLTKEGHIHQADLQDHIISSSSSIKALASWSARSVQEWKKVATSLMLLTRRATWGENNAHGTKYMNWGNSSKFFLEVHQNKNPQVCLPAGLCWTILSVSFRLSEIISTLSIHSRQFLQLFICRSLSILCW